MIGVNAETSTGMGAIGRMQVVVRYERVSHLYRCTPERQSLCESHRQRRWLTCWSYRCTWRVERTTEHRPPRALMCLGGLRRRRHGQRSCRACDAGTRLFGDDADLAADLPARRG